MGRPSGRTPGEFTPLYRKVARAASDIEASESTASNIATSNVAQRISLAEKFRTLPGLAVGLRCERPSTEERAFAIS